MYEVSISYAGRSYAEGKKINWKDGVAALWTIVKFGILDDSGSVGPGERTLKRIHRLRRYPAWLYGRFARFVGHRVLEVGAGVGTMTRYLRHAREIVASDVSASYLEELRRAFAADPRVRILRYDLEQTPPAELGRDFDTILCLNVLEHVENDLQALSRLRELLQPGGRLVLLVPAMKVLYGSIDRAIGHYRRYEEQELVEKVRAAGFAVEHVEWLNRLGAFGWFLNARVLKRKSVPGLQAKLADWLVPWLSWEAGLKARWGMSLLLVARREGVGEETGLQSSRAPTQPATKKT
jgi:SAM-dependent methyltransferase